MRKAVSLILLILVYWVYAIHSVHAGSQPIRSKTGIVISASDIASQAGAQVLRNGGNAARGRLSTPSFKRSSMWSTSA